uniref:Uncharacterized protein n=1 Tax=Rhizophora mucronata TaxID=61149 RepID=A0A2P2P9X9_RHIMU
MTLCNTKKRKIIPLCLGEIWYMIVGCEKAGKKKQICDYSGNCFAFGGC